MKAPLNSIASSRVRENQAPAGTQTSTHSFALHQSHVTYLWIHFQKPSRLHFESYWWVAMMVGFFKDARGSNPNPNAE